METVYVAARFVLCAPPGAQGFEQPDRCSLATMPYTSHNVCEMDHTTRTSLAITAY
jgi:hypothetical protein